MSRVLVLVLVVARPMSAAAQEPDRLGAFREGTVQLSFGVRSGTCWAEDVTVIGTSCPCAGSVARVRLQLAGGRVVSFGVRARASAVPLAADSGGIQLGRIPAADAAKLLLALAARGGAAGEEVVAAASMADSAAVWPELLELARNTHLAPDTRRAAIFWLSQAAGEAATRGLDSIATDSGTDRALREHAVFALSQRPADEAVPALLRIARNNPDGAIRRKAVFWLGQTDDPRAVALFEEILQH
jgi:hypothetical protein